MSITTKIERLKEAIASESDPDLIKSGQAILSGMSFFYLKLNKKIASDRFENHCKSCEFNVTDPVEDMRVKDSQIPEASDKMCSRCGGCVLSYKLRQSKIKCEFWDE